MDKKTVLPGDFLSTEEEFEAGNHAFADDEGAIRADSIGVASEDKTNRTVSVTASKNVSQIKRGDIVKTKVALVKDGSAMLEIFPPKDNSNRTVLRQARASLPIRFVSKEYVERLKDMFKIGDIVKVKVEFVSPVGTDVRTNEPDLGVVKAFCSKCRKPLHLFETQLKCMSCGNTEIRKVSSDYLLK